MSEEHINKGTWKEEKNGEISMKGILINQPFVNNTEF